ncbi:MAG: hypothetical protein ABI151_10375 [Chitinophagaceae bacterium]
MFNEHKINNRIEKILNSLDGMQKAQPAPFFYTRLQARLSGSRKNIWEQITYFVSRPVVAFSMLALVMLLNMTVLLRKSPTTTTAVVSDQTYQSVYEDFSIASNAFYDYEIKEP